MSEEAPQEQPPKHKKPRKPRAPRKKKAAPGAVETPVAAAEKLPPPAAPPVTEPASTPPLIDHDAEERAAIHAEPLELRGAKPRKSGRRAWEINLRGDYQTWERVTTADNSTIIFRFKDPATDEQRELIHRNGFGYDEESKEASRPNDPAGRVHADKLSWYLKEAHRSQGAAISA